MHVYVCIFSHDCSLHQRCCKTMTNRIQTIFDHAGIHTHSDHMINIHICARAEAALHSCNRDLSATRAENHTLRERLAKGRCCTAHARLHACMCAPVCDFFIEDTRFVGACTASACCMELLWACVYRESLCTRREYLCVYGVNIFVFVEYLCMYREYVWMLGIHT
jgi:hypothetical protein